MTKNRMGWYCVAASVVALPFLLVGCDREVSRSSTSSTSSDGSSTSKQEVVSQSKGGTVTKDEASKTVTSEGTVKSKETTTIKSPDGTVTKEESKTTTPPTTP